MKFMKLIPNFHPTQHDIVYCLLFLSVGMTNESLEKYLYFNITSDFLLIYSYCHWINKQTTCSSKTLLHKVFTKVWCSGKTWNNIKNQVHDSKVLVYALSTASLRETQSTISYLRNSSPKRLCQYLKFFRNENTQLF